MTIDTSWQLVIVVGFKDIKEKVPIIKEQNQQTTGSVVAAIRLARIVVKLGGDCLMC